jgi:hypothetical protein
MSIRLSSSRIKDSVEAGEGPSLGEAKEGMGGLLDSKASSTSTRHSSDDSKIHGRISLEMVAM